MEAENEERGLCPQPPNRREKPKAQAVRGKAAIVTGTARDARVLDLLLIDQPADETAPRCIKSISSKRRRSIRPGLAEKGKRFGIASDRLLYALNWTHKAEQPDLDLAPPFARAPEIWLHM